MRLPNRRGRTAKGRRSARIVGRRRRSGRRGIVRPREAGLLGFLVGVVWAQQERCKPVAAFDFGTVLAQSEAAFCRGDAAAGKVFVQEAYTLAPCLDRVAPPELMARLSTLEALAAHFDQDPEVTLRWARAAEWIAPQHPWPPVVGTDHAIRRQLSEEGPAAVGGPEKRGLAVPHGGAVVLSGRLARSAEAPTDVPLLLQVADRDGRVVRAAWQEGASFPDDLLKGRGVAPVPAWWTTAP